MKKVLLLDMDGVLVDLNAQIEKRFFERTGRNMEKWRKNYNFEEAFGKEDAEEIKNIFDEPNFFYHARPIDGALDAVEYLMQKYEVFFCSSPWITSLTCHSDKNEWIRKYFGYNAMKRLLLTRDKTLIYGDILIDDKPEIKGVVSKTEIHKPFWFQVLFEQPYNENKKHNFLFTIGDWKGDYKEKIENAFEYLERIKMV